MKNVDRVLFTISLLSFITMLGSCVGGVVKFTTSEHIGVLFGPLAHSQDGVIADRYFYVTAAAFLLAAAAYIGGLIAGFFAQDAPTKNERNEMKRTATPDKSTDARRDSGRSQN